MRLLSPYLNFNGNFRQAMEFYQSCLGGKLAIQSFRDSPMPTTPETKDLVMHATLDGE